MFGRNVVATSHPLAAQAGLKMLMTGGNAVDAAIKSACDKVHATGKAFLAKIDPQIAAKDWNGAFKTEGSANAALEPIRSVLQAAYDKIGPGDISQIQLAMMNGVRVK